MNICPYCPDKKERKGIFCEECGAPLIEVGKNAHAPYEIKGKSPCPGCGYQLNHSHKEYCPGCGHKIKYTCR